MKDRLTITLSVACRLTLTAILVSIPANALAQNGFELLADDARQADFFGTSVAIEGNVAVVGAPGWGTTSPELDSGAAYVFRYDGSAWNQEQQLRASDFLQREGFGTSVDISGDVIIVGTPSQGTRFGGAYIFRHDGSTWVEEQKLSSMSATTEDFFGSSVSIEGDVAIVADGVDDDGSGSKGALYAFRYDGSTWNLEDKLTASDGEDGDFLGQSAGLSGTTAIGGAHLDDFSPTNLWRGSAYVFEFDGSAWSEKQKLTAGPDEADNQRFGQGADIDGSTLMVGAPWDVEQGVTTGAVYVFRDNGSEWVRTQRLVSNERGDLDLFGHAIAISGNRAVIGAAPDFRASRDDREGTMYLFTFDGSSWSQKETVKAPDGVNNDRFGLSVDTDGNWVIVGAPNHTHTVPATGAAYIYDVATLVANEEIDLPARDRRIHIDGPYPNPSHGVTTVVIHVTDWTPVRLDVYDLLGRRVATLADRPLAAGRHSIPWSGDNLPNGLYLFRLTSNLGVESVTGMLIR